MPKTFKTFKKTPVKTPFTVKNFYWVIDYANTLGYEIFRLYEVKFNNLQDSPKKVVSVTITLKLLKLRLALTKFLPFLCSSVRLLSHIKNQSLTRVDKRNGLRFGLRITSLSEKSCNFYCTFLLGNRTFHVPSLHKILAISTYKAIRKGQNNENYIF